jgi:hypothetical protein
MKVAELTGALLDLWVARAIGVKWAAIHEREGAPDWCALGGDPRRLYAPSSDWSTGGPLLDRFEVCIGRGQSSEYEVLRDFQGENPRPGQRRDRRYAVARLLDREDKHQGDTALIAGMRAIVASVYGKEVPDQPQQEG